MRVALWSLVVAGLATSLAMGSAAFDYATAARSVTVVVAGDAAAYLSIAANVESPHHCFVDTTDGKIGVSFDVPSDGCGAGTGAGINAGDGSDVAKYSRYAFHDILAVTNKAPSSLTFWVNATTTSGGGSALEVALEATSRTMGDASYSSAETLAGVASGDTAWLGLRVKSGTLTSGSVTGTILVEARR